MKLYLCFRFSHK